jgi:O-succinylbenzoate synthase
VKLDEVQLHRLTMPIVAPLRTSFGTISARDVLLVRVLSDDGVEGWGECVADISPLYSSEYVDGASDVLRRFLVPTLAREANLSAASVGRALAPFKGHRMAKAAIEVAVLDAELRARQESVAEYLGGIHDEVACGVSIGIMDSTERLLDAVAGYLDQGYRRIKLKIEPGWDVAPVCAVREQFGDIMLQVDANTAYTRADVGHLRRLDEFDLSLLEQPLPADDLLGHARLAGQLRTPICLDESIESAAQAADAIALGACSIINIKTGRVGGLLEARRIHDVCMAHGVPVWCGGMLETGIGRAANVALASLAGFTLPGDTSASSRYYEHDITEPFILEDGHLRVPIGPGIGVAPLPDRLAQVSTSVETIAIGQG